VISAAGCVSSKEDVSELDEAVLNAVISIEPHSHGQTVVLSMRTLDALPPSMSDTLRTYLPKYFPTLNIIPAEASLRVETPSSPDKADHLTQDAATASRLVVTVTGQGKHRDVTVSLMCGPLCGIGFRHELEWRNSRWRESARYPILH